MRRGARAQRRNRGGDRAQGWRQGPAPLLQTVTHDRRVASAARIATLASQMPPRTKSSPEASPGIGLSQVSTLSPDEGVHAPFSSSGSPLAGARDGRNRTYAALDLGTNNCRLLVARPTAEG